MFVQPRFSRFPLLSLSFSACLLCIQAPRLCRAQAAVFPTVRAGLAQGADTSLWKAGDSFLLSTATAWYGGSCTIRANTILTGEVVRTDREPGGKFRNRVGIRFAAVPCAGEEAGSVLPVLTAMDAAPAPPPDSTRWRSRAANVERWQLTNLFSGRLPTATAGVNPNVVLNSGRSIRQTPVAGSLSGEAEGTPLKTGEVRGVRGMSMEPPQDDLTTLVFSRKVMLARHTQFLLLFSPAASGEPPVHGTGPISTVEPVLEQPPEHLSDAQRRAEPDACVPGRCRQAVAGGRPAGAAIWTQPLAEQGWKPRPGRTLKALDEGASIHSLGEDELLVTFPLHTLVHRTSSQLEGNTRPGQVRGLLLSRKDGRVLKQRDWTVEDTANPYVWAFGADALLVHEGDELVAYGPGWTERARWRLPGPLVFVSASPEAERVVAATVHETHTAQERRKLQDAYGPDVSIEEEYDLTGLDHQLLPLGSRRMEEEPTRPALLRSSLISVDSSRSGRFSLEEDSWEGKRRPLTDLSSACGLGVEALAHGLLFAQGCPVQRSEISWFRVLASDGATELKGKLAPFELLQQAQTDAAGSLLAMATTQFDRRTNWSANMHEGDFTRLTVTVYSVETGRAVFEAHMGAGSALREPLALAPSGQNLAIFTAAGVQAYRLSPGKAK